MACAMPGSAITPTVRAWDSSMFKDASLLVGSGRGHIATHPRHLGPRPQDHPASSQDPPARIQSGPAEFRGFQIHRQCPPRRSCCRLPVMEWSGASNRTTQELSHRWIPLNDRKEEQHPSGSGQPGAQPEQGRNGEQTKKRTLSGSIRIASSEQPAEEQIRATWTPTSFSTN